ncbi:site-specific integrase [Bosea sp. (in: a-proteobacteria)]|jgi:integrase|uniref:site-specific integrase n=1 Tax=Bosea sp. (in: a-proteobacteria) TaxID=1871050 RepID=UPI003F713FB8
MRKRNSKNQRIKRDYLIYLAEAQGRSKPTQDQAMAAIAAFETSTGQKDFALFHIEQARGFKRQLSELRHPETKAPLATATIHARLMAVKAFFHWLVGRQGYRRLAYGDVEYFNPSTKDARIATAKRERPAPSVEMVLRVVQGMPAGTDIQKRDRAVIAFALVSGARDNAIASFRLKHVDLGARTIAHEPRDGVRTKFSKTYTTWFFPVGGGLEAIIADWIAHLRTTHLFGPDDPLFPATEMRIGADGGFRPAGLSRQGWASAEPIRRIFRQAFAAAGLPYFNPHSLRKTLAAYQHEVCATLEEHKAWSQNLGHEKLDTTFTHYGAVPGRRQAEIFAGLRAGVSRNPGGMSDQEVLRRAAELMQQRAS